MRRVIILAAILALALAGTAWAELPSQGQRITYGGYVHKYLDQAVAYADADTLICVFNPNNVTVSGVGIAVFDKYGLQVADAMLLDGGAPVSSIPAKGWAWRTLAQLVPPHDGAMKYTFVVYWVKPSTIPWRGMLIEIKEILYMARVPAYEEYAGYCWEPSNIRCWSETDLGATGVKAK